MTSSADIWRAAGYLIDRYGVVRGARKAGVHWTTLRAAAVRPMWTMERTAKRIVRAGLDAGAFEKPIAPPAPPSPPQPPCVFAPSNVIPWKRVRSRSRLRVKP